MSVCMRVEVWSPAVTPTFPVPLDIPLIQEAKGGAGGILCGGGSGPRLTYFTCFGGIA